LNSTVFFRPIHLIGSENVVREAFSINVTVMFSVKSV
jgi:hypothetical protein